MPAQDGEKSKPKESGKPEDEQLRGDGANRAETRSLHEHYYKEAEKYKWIASEKAGHDLGDDAIREWKNNYWLKWCRARWIEHLEGSVCWKELNPDQFGFLNRAYSGNKLLRDLVLDRVREGWENLTILQWAISWGIDITEVTKILALLDMNSCRVKSE